MSEIKVGDRVRVEYEGVAEGVVSGTSKTWVRIRRVDGDRVSARIDYVTVIEPAYEVGAMYVDADGDYFMRSSAAGWVGVGCDRQYADSYPSRPLRKLVPEVHP